MFSDFTNVVASLQDTNPVIFYGYCNMETTKHPIPEKAKVFFNNLSEYLDIKLLYFGSIQRHDYFPGRSDIDVDVFTSNIDSTLVKMQQYMNTPKDKFKKIVWKLAYNERVVYGYKMAYKTGDFMAEFSIYDEKYKEDVIIEHMNKSVLPFYITLMLLFLKVLHYNFEIVDREWFSYFKQQILNVCLGTKEVFIVL